MIEVIRIEVSASKAKTELRGITNIFEKMGQAVDQMEISMDKTNGQVSQFDRVIKRTQKNFEEWIKKNYEILLYAKDRISPVLKQIETNLYNLSEKAWEVTLKASEDVTIPIKKSLDLLDRTVASVKQLLDMMKRLQAAALEYASLQKSLYINRMIDKPCLRKDRVYGNNASTIDYNKLEAVISQAIRESDFAFPGMMPEETGTKTFLQRVADIEPLVGIIDSGISIGQSVFDMGKLVSEKGIPFFKKFKDMLKSAFTSIIGEGKENILKNIVGSLRSMSFKDLGKTSLLAKATTVAGKVLPSGLNITGGVIAGTTVISGVMDLHRAMKAEDRGEANANALSAFSKMGGVAAGALIGSFIPIPIISTLVGAGIGGLAGWFAGDKIKENYAKKLKDAQEAAKALALSEEQAKYESEDLKEALANVGLSAEEFSLKFQKVVGENMKEHFGTLKLSLEEIETIVSKITFQTQEAEARNFAQAICEADAAYSNLISATSTVNKQNWKVSLGQPLSETEKQNFRDNITAFADSTYDLLESQHYESKVALDYYFGEDDSTNAVLTEELNALYKSRYDQVSNAFAELMNYIDNTALKGDDTIDLEEKAEINNWLKEITGITEGTTDKQQEFSYKDIKMKYGDKVDQETFLAIYEEMKEQNELRQMEDWNALNKNLETIDMLHKNNPNSLNYDKIKKLILNNYNTNVAKRESASKNMLLDIIYDMYGTELQSANPNFQGPNNALLSGMIRNGIESGFDISAWKEGIDPTETEEIAKVLGLEELGFETTAAIAKMLAFVADTVPHEMEGLKKEIETQMKANMGELEDMLAGLHIEVPVEVKFKMKYKGSTISLEEDGDTAYELKYGGKKFATKILKNAKGSIVNTPLLSWIGEDGPEAIIPLGNKWRSRGLELWEQAGDMLGIKNYASGAMAGGSLNQYAISGFKGINTVDSMLKTTPDGFSEGMEEHYEEKVPVHSLESTDMGQSGVQVNVQMTPSFHISGSETQSEESVLTVIRRHMKEMSDELGGQIAEQLERVFSNMPLHA